MIGNDFEINDNFDIEPSIYIKAVRGAPSQLDANLKFIIKKDYWVGASYRTGDAAVLMIGFKHDSGFTMGYSYDYILTDINQVASATHEIVLGFDFGGNRKVKAQRENEDKQMKRAEKLK